MAQHADEIDHLAAADVEGEKGVEIAAEDHPDRTGCRNQQADEDGRLGMLVHQEPGKDGAQERHEGEDRTGRHRFGELQRDEHRRHVDRHQQAEHGKPPGLLRP